jgi:hypothetical protein
MQTPGQARPVSSVIRHATNEKKKEIKKYTKAVTRHETILMPSFIKILPSFNSFKRSSNKWNIYSKNVRSFHAAENKARRLDVNFFLYAE